MSAINQPPRLPFLNVEVDPLTMDESVERAAELIRGGGLHHHAVINAGKVVMAQNDLELNQTLVAAALVNADGQAVVWAGRLLGCPLPERVAGIDFMDHLLARAALEGWAVYFLGAREDVVAKVAVAESTRHPGLVVAGARNGYWSESEEPFVVQAIAESSPKILFVALPSPQKERFVHRNRGQLDDLLVVGVGGSFDVIAGETKRAPELWQKTGLEWAYRLVQEPRRMWRRYLIGNAKFLSLVARTAYTQRRTQRPDDPKRPGPSFTH